MKFVTSLGVVILFLCLFVCRQEARQPEPAKDRLPAAKLAPPAIEFREVARDRGLNFQHQSGQQNEFLMPEIMGGGCGFIDMDQDGFLDIYMVQSGSLYQSGGAGNRLFRNLGEGRFEDVTETSGTGDTGYGMGMAVGDFDNDGFADLYVTNLGANVLYRNEGDGRFTNVTATAGVGYEQWSASAAFLDFNQDGWLDLFVTNYLRWSQSDETVCRSISGKRDYCSPLVYEAPLPDILYRNNGDGSFSDVSAEMGFRTAYGNGLGVVAGDFNGDGWTDIFVANDGLPNQMWLNQEGQRFVDEAVMTGTATDHHGLSKAGMGVAFADFDMDGDSDILVVNKSSETDSFYRNEGAYFSDHTAMVGLAPITFTYTRFGMGFGDFDNDGFLDLYFANGKIMAEDALNDENFYGEPNQLLKGGRDHRFSEVLPRGGLQPSLVATSRGLAFGDVDNDGRLDLLVGNIDGPAHLLLNSTPETGHWISLHLLEESGRHALGAKLLIKAGNREWFREVHSASSYLSANDPRIHLGLGDQTRVDEVVVTWLDGSRDRFADLPTRRVHRLLKGKSPMTNP